MSIKRVLAAAWLVLASCTHGASTTVRQAQGDKVQAHGDKIQVATTISTLNSFVQGVGGEHVVVKNIVPIGASPETFQPAPQDVATVADASVLVENGAGLETWLDRLLRDAGAHGIRVVICTEGLPVKDLNPHLWMDPVLAKRYVARNSRRPRCRRPRERSRLPAQCGKLRCSSRRSHRQHPKADRYHSAFPALYGRVP